MTNERILIIKHGALGDFVLALGPCKAIRRHHAKAQIILLTTSPFETLAQESGYFDEIWIDERAPVIQLGKTLKMRKQFRKGGFSRVYDLQTSDRSNLYYRFFPKSERPEWSGIAPGCSHFQDTPTRGEMHTVERQRDQLRIAGLENVPLTDFSWVEADIGRFDLPERFAVLIPGGSAHRLAKRWPEEYYAEFAAKLYAVGIMPVIIGGKDETAFGADIAGVIDLSGQTSFQEIAAIAARACGGVGNDTGPSHIAALAGAPFVALFSAASNPVRCAPRGPSAGYLQRDDLAELPVAEVWAQFQDMVRS